MVKYCPMCGYPNPDNAMFCVRCGYRFPQVVQPVQQGPQMQQPMQQYPQQYYVQPQPTQFQRPPSPYPPSYLIYNRKYFSMIAGITAGLEILFFGMSGVMGMIDFLNSIGSYFGSSTFYGFFGTLLAADIVYTIIGVFILIFGIKKSFSFARITGFIIFIYFLMYSISAFIVRLNTQGILLVLGTVFILMAVILSRTGGGGGNYMQEYFQQSMEYSQYNPPSSSPIGKVIGYSFGLVGIILTYFGFFGIGDALSRLSENGSVNMDPSYFGNNILAMVAGVIAMIGLIIYAFSKSSKTTKHVANIILEVGLILFGIGQIIVGAGIISQNILSGAQYLSGLLAAAAYMLYIGGIIDLIAGIFAILVSIFFIIEDAMKMSGRIAEEAI